MPPAYHAGWREGELAEAAAGKPGQETWAQGSDVRIYSEQVADQASRRECSKQALYP